VIDRDIDRCLPTHQRFRVVHGEAYVRGVLEATDAQIAQFVGDLLATSVATSQQSLEDILKAYAGYNPKIGYCQGMGMIAGMLLLHMPAEVHVIAV